MSATALTSPLTRYLNIVAAFSKNSFDMNEGGAYIFRPRKRILCTRCPFRWTSGSGW
jgi:hypothetical protein